MNGRGNKQPNQLSGFTRPDAMTLVGASFLLGVFVWMGIIASGETRRTFICAHRMKALGHAFEEYTKDHSDSLPPAVVDDGTNSTSWDREIAPYLISKSSSTALQGKSRLTEQEEASVATYFHCPSDKEPRGGAKPRSYSMPMYDLNKVDWPPDENCQGGLGLYLDAARLANLHKTQPNISVGSVPQIKVPMVPAPADTALLVERISIQNALWGTKFACTVSSKEQFDAKTFEAKDFHGGRMNYLMLDGHVELLSRAQSGGFIGNGGIWTIWRED
jgi:prepilin-type processing-associated H-X9-DG protein